MAPLRLIRRVQAPLICLAIAVLVSAGCTIQQETVPLGKPTRAYQADDGSILFGYYIEPKPQVTLDPVPLPEYVGWHWLIIEPETSKLMLQPVSPEAVGERGRMIAVVYDGGGENARLVPPLLEPGLRVDTPPRIGDGGLTKLGLIWDDYLGGARLVDRGYSSLPLVRVSPDSATITTRGYDREAWLNILKVAAVAGAVAGLILLGGSTSISIN
ncbi:MAG: hypothetical protein AAGC72_02850 [Planctomycetota bacterium]